MKKILVLSSFPAPYRVAVFKGLSQKFELDVFFATDQDQNRSKDYFSKKDVLQYYVISNMEDKKYFEMCVKKLRSYDMVLAYDWYLGYAIKVELQCILNRIPYAINCDGAFIPERENLKTWIKKIAKGFLVRHAKLCLSSGKFATAYFQYYGAKEERIVEHHFSSLYMEDILQEPVSNTNKIQKRKELGIDKEKMVLAIGQFVERKGFDVLLEAWKSFDTKYQLVIIGGGEQRESYQNIIKRNCYKHVSLMDFMPKEQVHQYYLAADLFVLPTREDVWGLVINEAMAVGLPVISTQRCNAAVELLDDAKNGYIVPVDDIMKLQYAIERILEKNETEIIKMSEESIKRIQGFTIENIVFNHCIQIDKLLKLGMTDIC